MDPNDRAGRGVRDPRHARLNPQAVDDDPVSLQPGLHKLLLDGKRSAYIYLPAPTGGRHELALLCMLHGAFGQDGGALAAILAFAQRYCIAVIAPQAMDTSWDIVRGGYGPDARFIEYLLGWFMQRHAVDRQRVALGGFSDGASYALSLGLKNGDLFTDIIAFSPGFVSLEGPVGRVGRPRIFIAHGSIDPVLPLKYGQEVALTLSREGYAVHFEQFSGGHVVPAKLVEFALTRFLSKSL